MERLAWISAWAMVVVWIAYPLAMALYAACIRRRPHHSNAYLPSLSVVIATREDPASVHNRVENCLAATYDPERLEVIVAVDAAACTFGADDVPVFGERVRVVVGDAPGGKAGALNAAVRHARGEVLVFTDTYQRFAPDALRCLVECLSDRRFGAVSGNLELLSGRRGRSATEYYWRWERWLRMNEARIHSSVGVTGAIYAMRSTLWEPLPMGLILDDVYVPMRIALRGYRVGFAPGAKAFETRRPAVSHEYRRKVRTLAGNVQLIAWLPDVLVPIRNPIWLQYVFHKLLRLLTPYWVVGVLVGCSIVGVDAARHAGLAVLAWPAAVVTAIGLVRPPLLRRIGDLVYEGVVLQLATAAGTWKGITARWDVWK